MKCILVVSLLIHVSFLHSILIDETPSTTLEGPMSEINHPEGITFSHNGDFIIITNSQSNKIHFYDRTTEGVYETTPCYEITGSKSYFNYPHDLSISLDSKLLAVACPRSSSVVFFKKSSAHAYYESTPFFVLKGRRCGLFGSSSVKFSPTENILAVTNVWANSIVFFHYEGDTIETTPFQIIPNWESVLNRPDGCAFSNDGEMLAVTSHAAHSAVIYKKGEGGCFLSEPAEIIQGSESNLYFTHSLSFHPLDDTLAISNASGTRTLNLFEKISNEYPKYSHTPIQTLEIYNPETVHLQKQFSEEGGVKGVAFSPNGKYIGVCASNIGENDRAIYVFPVK